MSNSQKLTKSQIKTATPILEETKILLACIRDEGIDFTLGTIEKDLIKDHDLLPDHTVIKLILTRNNTKYRVLDLRITPRGKLLPDLDNGVAFFTKLKNLKDFII